MTHPTFRKIFRLLAVLTVASGFSACSFQQSPSLTGENTATEFTSYTTYPETIPRWGSADPHLNKVATRKAEASFDPSTDWGHGILTQLGE